MKRIFSVLVENRSGVLCKVAGLFSRRCFNIDSLAVGETDDKAVSMMTIVSTGSENTMAQVEKQLKDRTTVRLMAQSEAVEAFVRGKLTTVEVIEPKQLRFSIIARLREALDQYEA